MQIQGTGYQQNFGDAVIAPLRNKRLFVHLINLDTHLKLKPEPTYRFIPVAKQDEAVKFLFVDGEDAKIIQKETDIFDRQLREGVETPGLTAIIKTFQEMPTTKIIPDEISTLDDLLRKVPMLEIFRDVLSQQTIIF